MIYLDNAGTTPIDPEVLATMVEHLRTRYGNPSSKYYEQALLAQDDLKKSREQVGELLGCDSNFLIFTSGATESNNFILKGISSKKKRAGRHIITSIIEHKSIIETCKYLETQGFEVSYVHPNAYGIITYESIESLLREDTILVSIMWANNEIGTLNEVEKIGALCSLNNVLFHTDATQVLGKIKIELRKSSIDFLSASAHKIYGPKGIGIAYLGPDDLGLRYKIPALLHGGDQEYRMRAGTQAMHDIVGFGKACEIAQRDLEKNARHMHSIEEALFESLLKINPDITFNGSRNKKIPGILNINIPGINNEIFCKLISADLAISTGSACSIHEPSHVMQALSSNHANDYVRISLSKYTSDVEEIIFAFKKYLTKD